MLATSGREAQTQAAAATFCVFVTNLSGRLQNRDPKAVKAVFWKPKHFDCFHLLGGPRGQKNNPRGITAPRAVISDHAQSGERLQEKPLRRRRIFLISSQP